MEVSGIIAQIDAQIVKLQQARALLAGSTAGLTARGRPKGSKNAAKVVVVSKKASKRKLSPEGRKRIAEAMKKRWADRRKQLAKG